MTDQFGAAEILKQWTEDGCESRRLVFEAGQTIHEASAAADSFFLIETGEVRIYHAINDGPHRLLDILGPGQKLGYAVLAQRPDYGLRAVAMRHTVLWALPADELRRQLSTRRELALHLLESMAKQLHDSLTRATAMASGDCRHRIVQTLLRFSDGPAAQTTSEGVTLFITHAQLALAIGVARETVSACLAEMRHENIVRTGRNHLMFNPDQLRELDTTRSRVSDVV